MSADDIIRNHHTAPTGADDPYATRSLPVRAIVSQPADSAQVVAPPRARRARTQRRRSRGNWLLNLLLLLIVLALAAAGGGVYYLDRSYAGKIYPNVTIQGIAVGELTPAQAEAALQARYASFLARPLILSYEGRTWQPTAEQLGMRFDFADVVEAAYRSGRGNGLIADLQQIAAIWEHGLELPLHVSIDQRAMHQYIQAISAELDQAPRDATLRLDGISVSTTPAQIGRQVLVDQTVQDLTAALSSFTPQTLPLRTRELQPRLHDEDVAAARTRIEALLAGPLTLTVEEKAYEWPAEDLARMLDIARVPADANRDRVAVALNDYQVSRRVRAITDETGRGSVNPRVAWNNGNLVITKPGKPGMRLDEAQARAVIANWSGGEQRTIALPVQVVEPQVTEANLHTLGINELVSVGRSDFSGSAEYRIINIGVGMQKFDGIVLAPGEEFSFNEYVGSIDARNGFVEGYAIIQNRTQLEYGGGICQDSTTMFRAAFWAGLPITERWGHSFYISWYDKYALGPLGNGPGMDATIFTGGPDLKFVNDTGHWLLIQAYSNPATGLAEVALYGTKPNRTVAISQQIRDRKPAITEPVFIADSKQPRGTVKRTDTARGGMTIEVYRTVTENGVQQQPELFRTVFKPWADKYAVNPADIGPDGRPLISWNTPPAATPQPTPAPEQPAPPAEQPAPPAEQPAQ